MSGGLVTLGETMALLRSVEPGVLSHADRLALGLGGAESNVAIGVTRLGLPAAWIGVLGQDSLGDRVQRELRAEGLELHVRRTGQAPTGLMIKESVTADHRAVWYYRAGSAGSTLAPSDVSEAVIAGAAVLHLTGITPALSPSAREACFEAIRLAKNAGVHVSFDVNFRSRLWDQADAAPVVRELAQAADTVFGGVEELEMLLPDVAGSLAVGQGGDERERAEELLEVLAVDGRTIVAKLGAHGAAAREAGRTESVTRAAVPISVIDTVGAGDAFVAGYLAELMAGHGLAQRLDTAVKTGAFACLSAGDWEGLPTRGQLGLLGASEGVVR